MDKCEQFSLRYCNQILEYSLMEEIMTFLSSGNRLHKLRLILGNLCQKGSEHNSILEYYLTMILEYRIERLELKKKSESYFQQSVPDIFAFGKVPLSFLYILTNKEFLVSLKHILQDLFRVYRWLGRQREGRQSQEHSFIGILLLIKAHSEDGPTNKTKHHFKMF
jgi:hypothetical protein